MASGAQLRVYGYSTVTEVRIHPGGEVGDDLHPSRPDHFDEVG